MSTSYEEVYQFWFKDLDSSQWFKKSEKLDEEIRLRFGMLHESAQAGELFLWRSSARGSLAEIIILDQFSRNIYRDSPLAFASDGIALVLAQEAIAKGFNKQLPVGEKAFLYMPFMHSESLLIHEQAIKLFSEQGLDFNLEYELKHKQIIEKFGRYPHRNKLLGRTSTSEEIEFLKTPGSSF